MSGTFHALAALVQAAINEAGRLQEAALKQSGDEQAATLAEAKRWLKLADDGAACFGASGEPI